MVPHWLAALKSCACGAPLRGLTSASQCEAGMGAVNGAARQKGGDGAGSVSVSYVSEPGQRTFHCARRVDPGPHGSGWSERYMSRHRHRELVGEEHLAGGAADQRCHSPLALVSRRSPTTGPIAFNNAGFLLWRGLEEAVRRPDQDAARRPGVPKPANM